MWLQEGEGTAAEMGPCRAARVPGGLVRGDWAALEAHAGSPASPQHWARVIPPFTSTGK